MIEIGVEVVGGEVVQKRFEDFSAELPRVGRITLLNVARAIVRRMKEEPSEFEGKNEYLSPEQRMYLAIAMKRGEIKIPRPRTHRFAKGWKIQREDDGYSVIGSAVDDSGFDYATLVAGDPNRMGAGQSPLHQGRWPNIYDVMFEVIENLPEEAQDSVQAAARRRWNYD